MIVVAVCVIAPVDAVLLLLHCSGVKLMLLLLLLSMSLFMLLLTVSLMFVLLLLLSCYSCECPLNAFFNAAVAVLVVGNVSDVCVALSIPMQSIPYK